MLQTTIPAWVKGTPLETILNFQGDFIDSDEPIAEGEELIGELSHYEKILMTLMQTKFMEFQKLVEEHSSCEEHGPENPECIKLHDLDEELAFDKKLFWLIVKKHFGILGKNEKIGYRQGFKIVKIKEEGESEESGIDNFIEALMGGGMGMGMIRIGRG